MASGSSYSCSCDSTDADMTAETSQAGKLSKSSAKRRVILSYHYLAIIVLVSNIV